MKRTKYIRFIASSLLLLLVLQACKKTFLDVQPLGSLNENNLANKVGVEGLLIGAYAKLGGSQNWGSAPSNWVFGSVVADDAYKGSTPSDQPDITPLENWNYNANNPYLNEKWVNGYAGILRANETIRTLAKATDISADDQKRISGEARFLRGYFHFDMKRIFDNIPFVDESITVANAKDVTNIEGSGYVNARPQIEADFKYAADNLPEVGYQNQAGRVNKWAAMAFLAKAYITQGKYNEAKPLFDQLITSGKTAKGETYDLVNYFSNFNPAQDNNRESVFAYQASVNDGSGTNGNYGDNLNFPNSGGPGGCCGFFNPSISLANAFKTDPNGLPLLETYNSGQNVADPRPTATPYDGTVDPRLDLTVGRKGVPYLDWGAHPGDTWIRDPTINGWFSPRKTAYAQSQQNTLTSTETSFWGPTQQSSRNVVLMRFSDLLLMAAETEIQATGGDPAKALTYVNRVRTRAADPTGWVYLNSTYNAATAKYNTQTTPAGNYKINTYAAGAFADKAFAMKAIMFERYIELGQEGHRFFDLQRWDKVNPGIMASTLNAYAQAEKNRPGFFAVNPTAQFTRNKNEIFPLPQAQIDNANSFGEVVLKQNPGY